MAERKFTLEEIAVLAGQTRRNARSYIQLGLVDRPEGKGGKGAYYTQKHIEQLLLITERRRRGLPLEQILTAMKQAAEPLPPSPRRPGTVEVWSHLVVDDGVEVTLDPGRARLTPEQVRAFFRAVSRAYQEINPRDTREPITDSEEKE